MDNTLKTAAEYALCVFEGHCNSNIHSLGCDYALSMLRNAIGTPLSDEDVGNLRRFNVQVKDRTKERIVESVRFNGGPRDGCCCQCTAADKIVVIPDANHVIQFVDDDGEITTLLGEHIYEMNSSEKDGVTEYRLEYSGHRPPILPKGKKQIGFSDTFFSWYSPRCYLDE